MSNYLLYESLSPHLVCDISTPPNTLPVLGPHPLAAPHSLSALWTLMFGPSGLNVPQPHTFLTFCVCNMSVVPNFHQSV